MNKTITAIQRGVKLVVSQITHPCQFVAAGRPVVCSHCGSNGFQWHGSGMAGSRFKPFVGGYALECCRCSHLEHFAKKPVKSKSQPNNQTKLQGTCLTTFVALSFTALTLCATAGDQKSTPDPTGTWKVTQSSTNTQARPSEKTLKLKLNGGMLTGTLSNVSIVNGKSRLYQWAIKDAKLQGSEISFSVTHPFEVGHGEVTTSYRGKIGGDAIKGMLEMEFMGQTYTRDWKAERLKE